MRSTASASATVTLLFALAACSSSSSSPPSAEPEPTTSASASEPSGPASAPASPPASPGKVVRGWPTTSRNRAGVYSWDGTSCAGQYCIVGFIHNGYGSGDVTLTIQRVGGEATPVDGWSAATFAGHDGQYRRPNARQEEWMVEIEGTTIAIHLSTRRGTAQAELAEAQAIIDSMRTERRPTSLGFRLVFTLTTNDWDSG
jgi:hypothetical protein